jgi:hypothetical protein
MSPKRATLILGVLGWRHADLRRKMNRFARTKYKSGDVWKWFNGMRGVPLPVAVFLRLSLRIARLSRRLDHAQATPPMPPTVPPADAPPP